MKISSSRLTLTVGVLLLLLSSESRLLQTSAHIAPVTNVEASCNCEDLRDLISRRREVNAALKALARQKLAIEAEERNSGKIIPYSDSSYMLYITNWVQMAIDAAHDKSMHQAHGPTKFTSDCSSTLDASSMTACLWQGVELNEAERQKWCEEKERGGAGPLTQTLRGDWMARYPLESFADVEQQGYERELIYLELGIKRLWDKCKFKAWSGWVIVTYSSQTKINESSPKPGAPTVPHQTHRTEDTTINETEQVKISLIEGYALPDGTADYSIQKTTLTGPERWCHASTQKNAWVSGSRTATEAYQISGPVYSGASVNVGWPGDGTYVINVHLPAGRGSGDSFSSATESGECAAKPVNDHYAVTDKSIGGFSVTGKGRAKQTDMQLDGSDQPTPRTAKGIETKITIEWHLKRSEGK